MPKNNLNKKAQSGHKQFDEKKNSEKGRRQNIAKKKKREPLECTLTVNVDFGENYDVVPVIHEKTVVVPEKIFEIREQGLKLFFRSIGKAISLQPKVMREIMPVPYKAVKQTVKVSKKFSMSKAKKTKLKKQSKK